LKAFGANMIFQKGINCYELAETRRFIMGVQIPPPPPTCGGQIYTVRAGDTLFMISRKFNVTLSELIAANPQITSPALIFPGQQICVPTAPQPVSCCLRLNPLGGTGRAGVFLLQVSEGQTQLLVAAMGLPNPSTLGANTYTALLSWDRVTLDIPMAQAPGQPGVWVGASTQPGTLPAAFFVRGSVDIFPGPVLGSVVNGCR
jgi:spore coat assembly protein SafA